MNEMITEDGKEIILIHYLEEKNGVKSIRCLPGLEEKDMHACGGRRAPLFRTQEEAAVTCPLCKK